METTDETADSEYFHALEDQLARLRGGWLLLSPADWQVARNWRRQGIPLELVRGTMQELYERRVARGSKRRLNSLRYFAPAIEAAWEEVRGLTAPGRRLAAPPIDVPARLAALASALPAELPDRAGVSARILALTGGTEAIESILGTLDRETLELVESSLDPAARADLDAAQARTLGQLAGRLAAGEVASAGQRLRHQLLRRRLGLPVLSLFSPEAQPAPENGESAAPD